MFNVRIRAKQEKPKKKKRVWNVCVAFHHDGDPIHCKRFQLSVAYYGWWLNRFYFILFVCLFVWFVLFSHYGCVWIAHQIWFNLFLWKFFHQQIFPYAHFLIWYPKWPMYTCVYTISFRTISFFRQSFIYVSFSVDQWNVNFFSGFFFCVEESSIPYSRYESIREPKWGYSVIKLQKHKQQVHFFVWIKWNRRLQLSDGQRFSEPTPMIFIEPHENGTEWRFSSRQYRNYYCTITSMATVCS